MTFLRIPVAGTRLEIPSGECSVCKAEFIKFNSMQSVCGVKCAQRIPVIARNTLKAQAKAERAKTKAGREALKTKPQLLEEAQVAFRAWVRARDHGKPCICCGKQPLTDGSLKGGQWDAGHYRSRGACPELAFDPRNCHAQLKDCNRHSWDVASYRANLIERIGLAEAEELEGPHPMPKWSRDDLREMRDRYRHLERELARQENVSDH